MKMDQDSRSNVSMRRQFAAALAVGLCCSLCAAQGWCAESSSAQPTNPITSARTSQNIAENVTNSRPLAVPSNPSQPPAVLPADPWQANQILMPEELAKTLAEPTGEKPLVVHVGPAVLWPNAHIEGSKTTGPGGKPEGIQSLKREVQNIPRDKSIVLYCGCCPWNSCPNIRPTFRTLRDLGFKNVKVLYLPKTFQVDWIAKGFPVKKD